MRATRAVGPGPLRVVVSHENITDLKIAENKLRERERELRNKTSRLEEANSALRAILRQRDEDRSEIEEAVFKNLKEYVSPHLDRLKQRLKQDDDIRLMEIIESGLDDVASPFLQRLSGLERMLTPQELSIASLIKEGKATKEIARILGLSSATVNFHRRNLREKLGLKNRPLNLRTHLLSIKK
jgi:DNA-binding CsgD family transcriptional regulator